MLKAVNKKKAIPYLLILPTLLLIIVFIAYPMIDVIRYSFMEYQMNRPKDIHFVGLENYKMILFRDSVFRKVFLNSIKWVVWEVGLQLLCGMLIASLLNKHFAFRGVARVIAFVPWAISGVLTALLWSLLYNQHIGIFSDILLRLGLTRERVAWIANTKTVFASIVVAELWLGIPFFAINILASLQSIPTELYEAGVVDGANAWQEFTYITLPHLKDTFILTTLLRTVWEFNSVDMIYTLTGGGPARKTTTLALHVMQQAFKTGKYSYGATLSIIGFIFLLIFALCYLKFSHFDQDD